MKKSVMTVKAMKEMYLNYDVDESTWNMMWEMSVHGLITSENWKQFYEECKGWYMDTERNGIADSEQEDKLIYIYDDNGFLNKVA